MFIFGFKTLHKFTCGCVWIHHETKGVRLVKCFHHK